MAATVRRGVTLLVALIAMASSAVALGTSANAAPYFPQPTCAASASAVAAGGSLTVSGGNWRPGGTVRITLHTRTFFLGSTTPGPNGNFSLRVTIPSSVSPGMHTIRFLQPGLRARKCTTAVTVTAAAVAPPPPSGPSPGLAFTGVAVIGIGTLGVILLIGGGVLLLLGRRRKAST